jgi:hypothetical protein
LTYQTPIVADYGSIADHTFTRCGGNCPNSNKTGSAQPIGRDKFCECSHTNLPDQCTCGSSCCA